MSLIWLRNIISILFEPKHITCLVTQIPTCLVIKNGKRHASIFSRKAQRMETLGVLRKIAA